ncbi:sulfotransferase domain-containing protein [bacterium]|nr:sulfotransferase domain-containing protein [bacterium]
MPQEPNLFVLGFQKCGTTTITDMLAAHPDVFIPSIKETYFFLNRAKSGVTTYKEYVREYFRAARPTHKFVGEGTPFYACDTGAMERLTEAVDMSASRFILVLRDPTKRAYSAYWHSKRLGRESLTFEQALDQEDRRVAEDKAAGESWWRFAYAGVGHYDEHVARVLRFVPRDQLLIIDDLDVIPYQTVRDRLSSFLGISAQQFPADRPQSNMASMPKSRAVQSMVIGKNPVKRFVSRIIPREMRTALGRYFLKLNSVETSYPPLNPATRDRLRAYFEPHLRATETLVGTDLSRWIGKATEPEAVLDTGR